MRRLLFVLYIVSFLIVLIGFYGMNHFTETVEEGSTGGGNGNPALFILVFLSPFFFYFLYGTIELSMRVAERRKKNRTLFISLAFSLLTAVSIVALTAIKVQDLRKTIIQKQDNFENTSQIPLWNTFSNNIFFNGWTFILVLLFCCIIGGIWAICRERKEPINRSN